MAGGLNLTTTFAKKVDERFTLGSQVDLVLNNNYSFTGAKTVKVSSIGIAPMVDYNRSGTNRFGSPEDLSRNLQELTINRDRGFSFIVDAGDNAQSDNIYDTAAALKRQINEAVIPEYDAYVFRTLAERAISNGAYAATSVTKSNAFTLFINGVQYLGDHNVPEAGRVAFCSYAFYNYLMQDDTFVKYSAPSQEMVQRGEMGEVDGVRIVRVPANRLPQGAAFLLVAKGAVAAPRQLTSYRIHTDPPGLSGTLCEGRIIYDAFVFDSKVDGVYYHGGQSGIRNMAVVTAPNGVGTIGVTINTLKSADANKIYYILAADRSKLPSISASTAIDPSSYTEISNNYATVTPGSNTAMLVVEVDSANKPVSSAIKIIAVA